MVGRHSKLTPKQRFPRFPYVTVEEVGANSTYARALRVSQNLTEIVQHYLDKGWVSSYRECAEKLGISPATFNGIIQGTLWPSMETIAWIESQTGREVYPRFQRQQKLDRKPGFLLPRIGEAGEIEMRERQVRSRGGKKAIEQLRGNS